MTEVKGQPSDVFAARILAPQNVFSEGSNLYVFCSTFGFKKHTTVFVYLCNNGTGVKKQLQKSDENDSTFIISDVTPKNSGEYSCVFSEKEYIPSKVNATGKNKIQILVIASFHPADLSLSGEGSAPVQQGARTEFVCSLPNVLQTWGNCSYVQSYLMREKAIYQVQGFDVMQKEARFVIQDVVERDSGQFSCVVRPSQCFREDEERLAGNNILVLQVKEGFPYGLTVLLTVVAAVILCICVCAMWRKDICISWMTPHKVTPSITIDFQREADREEQASGAQDTFSVDSQPSGYQNVGNEIDPYSYVYESVPEYDEVLPAAGPSNGNITEQPYAISKKSRQDVMSRRE
ncbi:hypothetical protein WMY93_013673 [Mugilogobius chulae]|uniref:Ig-like domain-containing protein n=1 Tax=Mugilogobius chulae TaxID=88201 RepID=A0AAW0PAR2_9GOBI